MAMMFYLDTSIWIDTCNNRKGFKNEPLGEMGLKLLTMILEQKHSLLITDIVLKELRVIYSLEQIQSMLLPFQHVIKRGLATENQVKEAKLIALTRSIPKADALHAIIARDSHAILVTRDNHFRKLTDICSFHKPEDII